MSSHRKNERGAALPAIMIAGAAVAAGLSTFAGRTIAEATRLKEEINLEQASWLAEGEIEFALCIIANADYVGGRNEAILNALASDPPVIDGTAVMVEEAGPPRWYRLTDVQEVDGVEGISVTYVRDGLSYVAYNYYVEDHDLGISGSPRGRIHTDQTLELYFGGSRFDSMVSAGKGFDYLLGADPSNTNYAGGVDTSADTKGLLAKIDLNDFLREADYVSPPGLEVDVLLQKDKIKIKHFTKGSYQQVPYEKEVKKKGEPVYQQVTVDVFTKVQQMVSVKKTRKVWVPVTAPSGGGGTDVAGGGSSGGYYKNETYYVDELKWVNVKTGTKTVWKWVDTYYYVTETRYKKKWVNGTLVFQTTVPADGIFYFPERIRNLYGSLNGKVTLVTEKDVEIKNSIQYVDGNGQNAFLNGLNANKPYEANPKFVRDHALGVIAMGDIHYHRNCPSVMEINASLVSITGNIGFAGIKVDANGNPSRDGGRKVKNSLRRLGSLMCAKRPVSTLLNNAGQVDTGFKAGDSFYDRSLMSTPPPGYPSEQSMMVMPTMDIGGAGHISAGEGVRDENVNPLGGMLDFGQIRDLTEGFRHPWHRSDGISRDLRERTKDLEPSDLDNYDAGGSNLIRETLKHTKKLLDGLGTLK